MAWRDTARWSGAALAVLCVSTVGTVRPASAQEIERVLVGVRLGSRGTTVLAKYGNPNNVVIGDIGVRQAPLSLTPTNPNGQPNGPGGLPGMPGGPGYPGGEGGPDMPGGGPGGGRGNFPGGGPMGFPGGSSAFPGIPGAPNGAPNGLTGFPGNSGNGPDDAGGGGGFNGNSSFGQTVSPLAREQEVTWVYNRKVGTNVVSYEFLIGPSGDVSQIVVSGYTGGNARTRKGIVLGSTYKDVVRVYGYPEDHEQVGNVLIASYKQRAHVSFQFLDQPSTTGAFDQGNKVIAITIATVE